MPRSGESSPCTSGAATPMLLGHRLEGRAAELILHFPVHLVSKSRLAHAPGHHNGHHPARRHHHGELVPRDIDAGELRLVDVAEARPWVGHLGDHHRKCRLVPLPPFADLDGACPEATHLPGHLAASH
uniref:Uncharacterized protein n=1 Tax=Leersia perrieri TaxID=77586 RepID=A0A0D9W4I0_9ORYZ